MRFEIEGKEHELKLTYKSIAELNKKYKGGAQEVIGSCLQGDLEMFEDAVYFGLMHTDEGITREQVVTEIVKQFEAEKISQEFIDKVLNEVVADNFFLQSDNEEIKNTNEETIGSEESGTERDGGRDVRNGRRTADFSREEIDKVQQDGFRYLGLLPSEVMNLSPREFQNMMTGRNEQYLDELQTYSIFALMMRSVYHSNPKKGMKPKDLFDRSKMVTDEHKKKSIENRAKQAEEDMKFLQNLNLG
ncbi:lamT-like tail assembly chaperone [Bacillus phage 0105phi7-2]|uniref:LamT-like tail assembly chaperone n=1 Tax=Bacillus phage 0105phi7-2 TaxID=3025408 RepID=A0AAE9YBB5_9CAUD|nr:lamT-like tail assembly chaperone [Bacillus phage 0105phi7-2]WCS66561.1 lamT-like tail assembly chaperone [Bacillus phage 0105phi7-2]